MTIVLMLSLGAGGGLALLLSFTRPVFYSIRSLEERFDIPVLGGILYVDSETDIAARRKSAITLGGYLTALLGIYGLVIVFEDVISQFLSGFISIGFYS
jgi:hypothetical protein